MTSVRTRIVSVLLWSFALWTFALAAAAQSVSTTTVQGTVYDATGTPTSGTLQLSWPAFSTAANQAIAAGRLAVTIGRDGFFSVNLAPNQGATPAGLYYTAVYHLADGTTSTEYWTIPAAAQTTVAQVRAQLMPASQAVQAVNKAYVDQAIQQATSSQVSSFGGTVSGPLYLSGDPLIASQAANKHYVDAEFAQALPLVGGAATGPITATQLGGILQADQSLGSDFGAKLQACINKLNTTYGGTCDARNFSGTLGMSAPLTIATGNITVQLPCATVATAFPIVIAAGTRNVTLHGCATRGTSSASGSQGGTVFLFSGSAALFQVGDSTYSADTLGFHLDNVTINTAASSAGAQALAAWRTQEIHLDSLYLLGNANQTALTLDGTGNYTGGTFSDVEIGGFLTAVNAIGHQVANSATTDWLNASTFLRLHIDCPTSNGNPVAGSVGINLLQGDGNTFTGGDVENCGTALHLGSNAQNNTIIGLRNENSTSQIVADTGSSYNNWITGGTMFTGKLTDNGTRNSFLDTFHRSFNALNGDWYGSQQDATLTNHFRLGIGSGAERGLLDRYQTDYGYRWTTGLSDALAGEQFYQVLDELNNVYRLSIGQYNHGQASTNNQTVLNSAGTGAVVLNGSNNAGTGGVVIGSGGATSATVATIDKSGNANFTGTLQVGGTSQSTGTMTVRNNADAEVDYYLWPGATASQKGSFTYKDYNGNSQWYLLKDASNNWALNSALGGIDSFKAYQSTNSGDTYINASNSSGVVRVNYETGSGAAFNIYGGNSGTLYAGFTAANAIKFPGLAAASGRNCMQIDSSGYITNTGSVCGAGIVSTGAAGQIAWYSGAGASVSGITSVPLSAGGTGATSALAALANLGAVPASGGAMTGPLTGTSASFSGQVTANTANSSVNSVLNVRSIPSSLGGSNALGNGARLFFPFANSPIAAGSNVLNCVSGGSACSFSSADIGKLICLGPALAVQTTPNEELCTTIAGVNSSSQITMAAPVPSNWTIPSSGNLQIVYASDDSSSFANVVSTYHGQTGVNNQAQIFLPCGIYGFSQSLNITNQLSLRGASRDCVILWYMGASPASVAPAAGVQPVTYAINVQGSNGNGVPSLSDLTVYGNTYVQEAVIDTVGTSTFTDVWIDGSTDYALQLWTVAWGGYNVVLQNSGATGITTSPNGMYLGGYPDAGGPNSCTSCTISHHPGIGLYVGKSSISMYSMQESGNTQNIFVEAGGRLHLYDGLVEYVGGSGDNGNVTSYGIIETMGGTSIGDPAHFRSGSIFYESTGSSFTGLPGNGFTFDGSGGGTGYSTASSVSTTSLYPSATCSGVTANITASAGTVTSATIANGGTGCKVGDYIAPVQSGGSGAVLSVSSVSNGAATGLQIVSGDAQYFITNGTRLSYSTISDKSRCGSVVDSPAIGSSPGTGWYSYHTCNAQFNSDSYAEVYGDWNMVATCTAWNTASCNTYPILPRALLNASAPWRAVFRGQWTTQSGTMLTTVPEMLELSSTSNTVNLGSGNTITVAEDNSTANNASYPNQLVMYANNANLQFTGTIQIWPNTASTQPTVSYQNVQAQTMSLPNLKSQPILGTDSNGNIVAGNASGTRYLWLDTYAPSGTAGWAFTQNATTYYAFETPASLTSSTVRYSVTTADNSANLYDLGIYSLSGTTATLICHMGATPGSTFAPATGSRTPALACSLPNGGVYLLAMTTNCASSCAVLAGQAVQKWTLYSATAGAATTGGTLNSSMTVSGGSGATTIATGFILY